MTEQEKQQALEARREYLRKWRQKNKKRVNAYQKQYRKENPEKIKEINARYWMKKAQEMERASK